MSKSINIVLADDHMILLEGLEIILRRKPEYKIIGKVADGEALLEFLEQQEADVVILDINMPKKDGIEVLKQLQKQNHDSKRIILSSYSDMKMVNEAMRYGASAYLTKKCARKEIVEAVESVLKDEQYYGETIKEKIVSSFQGNSLRKQKKGELTGGEEAILKHLSKRETEVLRYIALEFNSREIAEKLFISTNTVESHRKNLVKKLNVKNSIGLAKFAIKNKLI